VSTILLVRHGETVANREGRVQGHRDWPLTPLGESQARAYGRRIAQLIGDQPGWRLVSSPIGRCVRTAAIISECVGPALAPVTFDARLAEIDTGVFSGLTKDALEAAHPGLTLGTGLDHWAFKAPGGERHAALSARLADWLSTLGPDDTLVAVSHGIAGRVLRGLYQGLDPDAAMRAPSPQDALFVLENGTVRRVACD
jgi:probable phosphoglycerate mutase